MRIDPTDTIAGVSPVAVRDALRRCAGAWIDSDVLARLLKLDHDQSRRLLSDLHERGFVEPREDVMRGLWGVTLAGSAFLMASTARPVKRQAAQRHLDEFMVRLDQVNEDPDLLHWVTGAYLFGSMLDEQRSHVNDVDLAIRLQPRMAQGYMEAARRFADQQQAAGRRFANYTEYLGAPEFEIKRRLRARSRLLNLHDADRDDGFLQSQYRLIYSFEPPAA